MRNFLKLKKIEKQLKEAYTELTESLQERWINELEEISKKFDAAELLENKKLSEKLLTSKKLIDDYYESMINNVANDLTRINKIALAIINDDMTGIYLDNFISVADKFGTSFSMLPYDSAKSILRMERLLPKPKRLNILKDIGWNKKRIQTQMITSLLGGESIDKMAKRLQSVAKMNEKSAIRNARTMTTNAENKARLDSYIKAENELGLKLEKEWLATSDSRTRDSHATIDGERVPIREKFSNGLMYPGDPNGSPAEVYNCRCTMDSIIIGEKNANR